MLLSYFVSTGPAISVWIEPRVLLNGCVGTHLACQCLFKLLRELDDLFTLFCIGGSELRYTSDKVVDGVVLCCPRHGQVVKSISQLILNLFPDFFLGCLFLFDYRVGG